MLPVYKIQCNNSILSNADALFSESAHGLYLHDGTRIYSHGTNTGTVHMNLLNKCADIPWENRGPVFVSAATKALQFDYDILCESYHCLYDCATTYEPPPV